MPALTISTDKTMRSRSSSPVRPPMSPITPPLAPARPSDGPPPAESLPPARQTFTHTTQPSQQIGIPPPPPEAIDFESNPDVIALKSAISVLQVQKRRATGDIQALNRIRGEALDDPGAFIQDLAAGMVKPRDDFAFGAADGDEDDEEEGDEVDEEEEDDDGGDEDDSPPAQQKKGSRPREWSSLPKPQEVVRCPPLNWAQYAVVGESLDKLHAEQVNRPSQGAPSVFGSNGLYDINFEGKQERYSGVAAPYAPGKDRIDPKSRSKK